MYMIRRQSRPRPGAGAGRKRLFSDREADFARAEAYLSGALARGIEAVDVLFHLGVLQADRAVAGDKNARARAIAHFEKALAKGPDPLKKEEIDRFLKSLKMPTTAAK